MSARGTDIAEVGVGRIAAYGGVALPLAMLLLPLYVYLPTFYADDLGLGLTAVGGVLLLARVWDIVTDPAVGWLSDRWSTRWGRRRPWMIVGAPLLVLSTWQLLVPGDDATIWGLAVWVFIFYLSATLVQAPYAAWGAELSGDYHRRTLVTTVREVFTLVGTVVALVAAAAFASDASGSLHIVAMLICIALPISIALAVSVTPDRHGAPKQPHRTKASLTALVQNKPFFRLIAAYLLNGIANGLPAMLFLLFVGYVLGRADLAGPLLLTYFAAGIVGAPAWLWLSRRIGKHRAWAIGMTLAAVTFSGVPFLGQGDTALFAAICVLSGLALGADLALPPSLQADVIDVDTKKTGMRRAGLFFGLWNMATKLALALAVGMAFPLLDVAGFETGADTQTPQALFALALLYGGLPVAFKLAAIVLIWRFPISATSEERFQSNHGKEADHIGHTAFAVERVH